MATLNLGRIKPVFRGSYSGSTAYVVDDIVTSGGSSYICIQAHGAGTQAVTVTAYWSVLASTGTDVGATITTQGDILYRDGSGLQRLAKGTASQVLTMNSGATAPEWAAAAGIVTSGGFSAGQNFYYHTFTNQTDTNSTSYIDATGGEWTVGGGALTANKTCMFQYTLQTIEADWNHTSIRILYSVDDGSNWLYFNSSEDAHDAQHEISGATNWFANRSSGMYIQAFTSSQTPRFKIQIKRYTGSNNAKLNYDGGADGTIKSYLQAWFV